MDESKYAIDSRTPCHIYWVISLSKCKDPVWMQEIPNQSWSDTISGKVLSLNKHRINEGVGDLESTRDLRLDLEECQRSGKSVSESGSKEWMNWEWLFSYKQVQCNPWVMQSLEELSGFIPFEIVFSQLRSYLPTWVYVIRSVLSGSIIISELHLGMFDHTQHSGHFSAWSLRVATVLGKVPFVYLLLFIINWG